MCHVSVINFFFENVKSEEFERKRILEIGSRYVNGSVRPFIENFLKPMEYIGIDIEKGKYVDIVLPAEKIVDYFGEESFDVIICTEVIEHVKDWRKVINNMKLVLKKGGIIYITTRSRGFPLHDYPYDFWRYEIEDFKEIFKDFNILVLESDPEAPGVFLKAKKPEENYEPISLENISIYSMLHRKRINFIPEAYNINLKAKIIYKLYNSNLKYLASGIIPRRFKYFIKRRIF